MGRFYWHSREKINFPEGFEEDFPEQPQPQMQPDAKTIIKISGFMTSDWFGPFLLSRLSRRERGFC